MGEKDYYPAVRKWLEKRGFYCGGGMYHSGSKRERFYENIGSKAMRVDVAGVRNVGSSRADALEVVCIEVKASESIMFSQVAQAFGYSLVANRVYLANTAELDSYWDQFISRSGLGYLKINADTHKIFELIPSSRFNPDQASYLEFLASLWIVRCSICGVHVFKWDQIGPIEGKSFVRLRRGAEVTRMKDKTDHPYYDEIAPEREITRFVCRHCLDDLFFEEGLERIQQKGQEWSTVEDDE